MDELRIKCVGNAQNIIYQLKECIFDGIDGENNQLENSEDEVEKEDIERAIKYLSDALQKLDEVYELLEESIA